jgi:class 3 adenylate cyclase
MRLSLRNKLIAVSFSTIVFTGLALIFVLLLGGTLERAVFVLPGIGFSISLFEEFYVQGRPGRWLRSMHPAKSIAIYGFLIVAFAVTVMLIVRTALGPLHEIGVISEQLHTMPSFLLILPALFAISIIAIMLLRIVGYMGAKNLFNLMIGKYHRPVMEQRIFLFLDIKGSTALVERLGPIEARELIGKFFFDISGPFTDLGGEIYRFTGDGVVVTWDWKQGIAKNRIVRAIDAIADAVNRETDYYLSRFGHIPEYRIGVHGGSIVTSEEGDTKRAIGFYGDTIHIAARLEQMAKKLGIDCILSGTIAEHQIGFGNRLRLIGDETIRGISGQLKIYELRGSG